MGLLADHLTVGSKNADLPLGVGNERFGLLLKDFGTAVKELFATIGNEGIARHGHSLSRGYDLVADFCV